MHPPLDMAQIEPTKTKIALDIKLAVAVVGALLAGGIAAGMSYREMTWRMKAVEDRLGALATKADVTEVRYQVGREIKRRVEGALVQCPQIVRPVKGEVMTCKALIQVTE